MFYQFKIEKIYMKNLSFLLHNYETCFVFNKIKN